MIRLLFFIGFFFSFFDLAGTACAQAYFSPSEHTSEKNLWGEFETAGLFSGKKKTAKTEPEEKENALPPWLEHAVSVPDMEEDAPMIAIVIDDLGLNRKMTKAVLSLPAPITAAFLAYADDLPDQTEQARLKGHELLLHTPMEPVNSRFNPGPDALRSEMSAEEIEETLDAMLEAFSDYVGINNHMGSKFTSDKQAFEVVIRKLKEKGLLFLDSLTSGRSVAWKLARDEHVPYAVRDVFLDNSQDEEDIMNQLALLEKHAINRRTAVAIGHPHATTINALKKWIPKAKEKGFVFVPISMIALVRQDAF